MIDEDGYFIMPMIFAVPMIAFAFQAVILGSIFLEPIKLSYKARGKTIPPRFVSQPDAQVTAFMIGTFFEVLLVAGILGAIFI